MTRSTSTRPWMRDSSATSASSRGVRADEIRVAALGRRRHEPSAHVVQQRFAKSGTRRDERRVSGRHDHAVLQNRELFRIEHRHGVRHGFEIVQKLDRAVAEPLRDRRTHRRATGHSSGGRRDPTPGRPRRYRPRPRCVFRSRRETRRRFRRGCRSRAWRIRGSPVSQAVPGPGGTAPPGSSCLQRPPRGAWPDHMRKLQLIYSRPSMCAGRPRERSGTEGPRE